MKTGLKLPFALRVKSAEFWLKLGQPVPALLELQQLPPSAQGHPWVTRVLRTAFLAARGANLGESPEEFAI